MPDAAVASTKRIGPEGRCGETAPAEKLHSRRTTTESPNLRSGMRYQKAGAARFQPHLQKHSRWAHDEEGVEGRIDRLVKAQNHLNRCHCNYGQDLAGLRAHRR